MIEIKIKPISINACWQGRRFKTKKYSSWREEFGYLVRGDWNKFSRPTQVRMEFYISNFAQSDVDNMIKPTLDALQECGIIADDKYIVELYAKKFKVAKGKEKIICELKT